MTDRAATPAQPWRDLLRRHLAVARAAWAMRGELAGPQRLADELAFLPAALSLQESPVHPAPRRAMWLIVCLFTAALAWSIVGEVDIVAVAPGRIVVSQRTKLVQPLEPAVVRAIHVREGDKVQAGQLLIELDPTGASADAASVLAQRETAESEAQRSQALLKSLDTGIAPRLPGARPEVQNQLTAEWLDITARRARLAAELQRRTAELSTAREMLAKLQASVPLARQRETDIQNLSAQGFIAGHAAQDRSRERMELERDLATQQARQAEAQAALLESRQTQTAYLAETRRSLGERAAQAVLKAGQLAQEGAKTAQRERQTRLVAPVSGSVQQLAVHTTGGVVTAAQALMVVVPDDSEVIAEVAIDNQDIGFVKVGQAAEVKIDAFNFTRFGTVPATVLRVSADAVVDEKRGAIYQASLKMHRNDIVINGERLPLGAGLSISAELKTGRRRLLEFFISPLQKELSNSGRER